MLYKGVKNDIKLILQKKKFFYVFLNNYVKKLIITLLLQKSKYKF